jgi:hypothetical protein
MNKTNFFGNPNSLENAVTFALSQTDGTAWTTEK